MKRTIVILIIALLGIAMNIAVYIIVSNISQGHWRWEDGEWFSEKSPDEGRIYIRLVKNSQQNDLYCFQKAFLKHGLLY